jgi:hypothetical protein
MSKIGHLGEEILTRKTHIDNIPDMIHEATAWLIKLWAMSPQRLVTYSKEG